MAGDSEGEMDEPIFIRAIVENNARMAKIFHNITTKYNRNYLEDEEGGQLLDLSTLKDEPGEQNIELATVLKYSDVSVEESEMSDLDLEALQSIVKERVVKIKKEMNWDEEEIQIKQEKQVFSTSLINEDSEDITYTPMDKRNWKRQRESTCYEYDSSSFDEDEESTNQFSPHNTCLNHIPVVSESQLSSSHCPLCTGNTQPLPDFQRTLPDCFLEDHCYCNEYNSSICYEDGWPEVSSSSSSPSLNSHHCHCAECQNYQYFQQYDSTLCHCYHCRTHSLHKELCSYCYCQYECTDFSPPMKKTRK